MGINFIFDEELEKSKKELQQVINTLEEDTETKRKSELLKTFARAVALSLKKPDQIIEHELIKPEIKQKPLTILNKLIARRDIHPIVKKIPLKPKPELQQVQEKKPEIIQKDLILDKITNKVLAYVKITDRYFIIEPQLEENDINILNKVLSKRPKNMEKGWKLISKYGKKFNVLTDHFTNIKYYVVNYLYGLGKIEPLVYDKDITEIYCEGTNKPIKVKYNNKLLETNITYKSKEDLNTFIFDLAYKAKQKIKKKSPSATFNYRDLYFECTASFTEDTDSKFIIKK